MTDFERDVKDFIFELVGEKVTPELIEQIKVGFADIVSIHASQAVSVSITDDGVVSISVPKQFKITYDQINSG